MPSATRPSSDGSRATARSSLTPEQEKVQGCFAQRARQMKKVFASDQYSTASIHGMRVKFLEIQFAEYEREKREIMLNRNLDLLAEFGRLADKRRAIEKELELARQEYQEQMDELTQRLDAALSGLAKEAREAGLPETCNFKDDSITG